MTVWLALCAVLAGNALAGGTPRASAPAKSGSAAAAPAVPALSLGVASLTPGAGPALLSPAAALSAPALAPVPTLDAAPAAAQAPAAPAASVRELAAAPAVLQRAGPTAERARDASSPASAAPALADAAAAPAEGAAAPARALDAAQWTAAAPELRVSAVFDGERGRGLLERLVPAGAVRPAFARLTRGAGPSTDGRYRQPPAIARREAALQAGALGGGAASFTAFALAGGPVLVAVLAVFAAITFGLHRLDHAASKAAAQRAVVPAHAFRARAQALLDGMRPAASRPVTVLVVAGDKVNAFWSESVPDAVFVTRGASVLDDARLRAVMAHELGHRAFGDSMRPLILGLAVLRQITWVGALAMGAGAALSLLGWDGFAPPLWSLAALAAGLLSSFVGQVSLGALPRLWEYRADHFAAWLTSPKDLARALAAVQAATGVKASAPRGFFASHPDTRRRIVELRGQEAPAAPKGRMPEGVKDAFRKAAVIIGGMGALFTAGWFYVAAMAPQLPFYAYAGAVLPLAILPVHFALVAAFWASRYWLYPKLGARGKSGFRAAWAAGARLYAGAGLLALSGWSWLLAGEPIIFLPLLAVLAFAAGEIVHHFVYRLVPERKADQGKGLFDWRSRLGGNIGQQLSRMRRKPD